MGFNRGCQQGGQLEAPSTLASARQPKTTNNYILTKKNSSAREQQRYSRNPIENRNQDDCIEKEKDHLASPTLSPQWESAQNQKVHISVKKM